MQNRASTHLSAQDINAYLSGNPVIAVRTTVEAHCLECRKCLEYMCALTTRIAKVQLAQEEVSPLISSIPGVPTPIWQRQPLAGPQSGHLKRWSSRALAASLLLLVTPDSLRFVGFDHLLNSGVTTTSLNLPFTREYPSSLALIAMPKVELESVPQKKLTIVPPQPQRQFRLPQVHARNSELVQVALIDAPDLNFTDDYIDPLPKEIQVIPAAAMRVKPHILRRLISLVAAPFRSPRS